MHIPSATVSYCEDLAKQCPDVRELLDDHINDNDELLPHVFFGDVTRWILADRPGRIQVVKFLDQHISGGNSDIENLIAVSFIENLESQEELEQALANADAYCLRNEWVRQRML